MSVNKYIDKLITGSLKKWFVGNEGYIARGMNDLGELKSVFEYIVGRKPEKANRKDKI